MDVLITQLALLCASVCLGGALRDLAILRAREGHIECIFKDFLLFLSL